MKKIIAAAALMFLFASIAQAGKPQPSAQGKWAFTFTGGATITAGAVNIVQDAHGNLNSPFYAGYVAGNWYQNYEAFSDSTCSPSGWAPVQPTGSNVNGSFNFKLQVDTGIFYDLKGNVSDDGTTMTGSYTSNCSSDHGTFTGSLYAPVNKTYIGIVNGSNDDGTVTQYSATLVLTEDAQFNVTGSILLNTPSGTATCYGTIQLSGPATGEFKRTRRHEWQCTDAWAARVCRKGGLQFGERADFGNRFAGLRQRSSRRHAFIGKVEEAQFTAPIRTRGQRDVNARRIRIVGRR